MLAIDSNLLAHHLDTLEKAGLIERLGSQGDRRRRYIRLRGPALATLEESQKQSFRRIVFVCTENIARSQLAAVLWNHLKPGPMATSGGTSPGPRVHRGAIRAAARRGLDLRSARPRPIPPLNETDLVVTVCDRAHESFAHSAGSLHWSVPDPVASVDPRSFEAVADILDERIHSLASLVAPA